MFPAHAGMIRLHDGFYQLMRGVPRPRGDDPAVQRLAPRGDECSPPTRG